MNVQGSNADRFLDAYAKIEKQMNDIAGTTKYYTFSRLLSMTAPKNRTIRANQEYLREYSELRNAIVHQRDDELEIIAQPTDRTVENIERIASLLTAGKRLYKYATMPVKRADAEDDMRSCFAKMREMDTTKLPVYRDDVYIGLATMTKIAEKGLDHEADTVRAADLIEQETPARTVFFAKDSLVEDAAEVFEEALHEGRRPPVILITETGSYRQKPLGIITSYDLPKILAALTL